jgi:GNAT superfamily N-acetyltransferase
MILPGRELIPVVRAALENGQHVRMTVTGSSMLPFIRNNEVVELEPAPKPRLGDMVLVQGPEERYVLHRIVRKASGTAFLIRGDAQTHFEGPFTVDVVLGRVTTVWRRGRGHAMGGGLWRVAGLVWMSCTPFNVWLLWSAVRLRRLCSRVLRRLQRFAAFRGLIKRFRPAYIIEVASQSDLLDLCAWIVPNGDSILPASGQKTNPYVTNYVARSKSGVIGQVCLMRHPESDFPRTGQWLYSLEVQSRYRGMGIGEALTKHVIDQSRLEGEAELFLFVFEDNAPAIALYRSLGFEPVSLPELEAEWVDDVKNYGRRRVPLKKTLR